MSSKQTESADANVAPEGSPQAPQKRPIGRPSKYKPEFCQRVLELAAEGCGWADYAAEFNVDRKTLFRWGEDHEEFRAALSRAKVLEQVWWEKAGRTGMGADKFNALVWKTSVQARFRDDYTEKRITEVSGPDGSAIKTESVMSIDTTKMDATQREALKAALLSIAESESK